jgi:hypothetical protein
MSILEVSGFIQKPLMTQRGIAANKWYGVSRRARRDTEPFSRIVEETI